MSYRIEHHESTREGIRRIAHEQIDKAVDELSDSRLDFHEKVHQARKRCKKLRGLIRLVRPGMESTYQQENEWFRDTARPMSDIRDGEAMLETYDRLMKHFGHRVDRRAFAPIRQNLEERRDRIAGRRRDACDLVEQTTERLLEAKQRVDRWPLDDWAMDAVEAGLKKTYRRGRKAMADVLDDPTDESHHAWRKRVKYYRYHTRLMRRAWSPVMKSLWKQVRQLSNLLGQDHDLAVMRDLIGREPGSFGDPERRKRLLAFIAQRQSDYRTEAYRLGARVYADQPKRLARRMRQWWQGEHRTDRRTAESLQLQDA